MFFASGFFLWLLPLAALPVVFHLLLKRRQNRLDFPDLMFFIKADPRMHARRRLREILLLAARILLLLLLLLTLSRPVLRKFPAADGRIALVIVMDNSGSMDGLDPHGQIKLDLAREAAIQLLNALDENSSAVIVPLVADPVLDYNLSFTADRDESYQRLARIRQTEARGSTAQAFRRVRTVLNQVPAGTRRAVHIFTDLHTFAWEATGANGIPFEQTEIVVHRIPSLKRHDANITVESLTASRRILLPGHPCKVEVGLHNPSAFTGDVRVNIYNNQDKHFSRRYTIGPGMTEYVRYDFTPDAPGEYWIMAELEGDSFRGDNRAGMAWLCREKAAVWFIGARNHYGLMPTAVSPSGTGRQTALVPVFKELDTLFAPPSDDPPAMIVGTWSHLAGLPDAQAENLRRYIAAGGQLFVVPDALAPPGDSVRTPDWLGIRPGPVIRTDADYVVGRILDPTSGIWEGFHAALEIGRLRFFLMYQFAEFEAWSDYRLLAGVNPRHPVLAKRTMGEGMIYASGIAWDPNWTSLAADPSGIAVVMIHNIANSGLEAGLKTIMLNVVAGETLPIPVASAAPVKIRSLAGDTLETSISSPPMLARAGAYRLESDGQVYLASVRGASEEAADTYVNSERLAALGAIPHHIVPLSSSGQDIASHLSAHFRGRSLYIPLAVLTLLAWAVEAWLSTLHSRPDRRLHSAATGSAGGIF